MLVLVVGSGILDFVTEFATDSGIKSMNIRTPFKFQIAICMGILFESVVVSIKRFSKGKGCWSPGNQGKMHSCIPAQRCK
jgi:hypothetical protein